MWMTCVWIEIYILWWGTQQDKFMLSSCCIIIAAMTDNCINQWQISSAYYWLLWRCLRLSTQPLRGSMVVAMHFKSMLFPMGSGKGFKKKTLMQNKQLIQNKLNYETKSTDTNAKPTDTNAKPTVMHWINASRQRGIRRNRALEKS